MKYRARAAELAAVVSAVAGSGIVHARTRFSNDWARFIRLFLEEGAVNGWEITRRRASPDAPDLDETWLLRKYRGVHDESESDFLFQEDLDAVSAALRDLPNLSWGSIPDGLRIVEIDERMFGDVLCHYAECELRVLSDWDGLE